MIPAASLAVVSGIFALDRLTKVWTQRSLGPGDSLPILRDILHLTYIENTGAAFGLLRGSGVFLQLFSALSVLVLSFYLWRRGAEGPAAIGWLLVLAGAAGNLYDRVIYGYVIDMIDLRVWPVFNIADTAISVGVVLVLWSAVRPSRVKR